MAPPASHVPSPWHHRKPCTNRETHTVFTVVALVSHVDLMLYRRLQQKAGGGEKQLPLTAV